MKQIDVANDALEMCFNVLIDSEHLDNFAIDDDSIMVDLAEHGILFFDPIAIPNDFVEILRKVAFIIDGFSSVTVVLLTKIIEDAVDEIEELNIFWGIFSKN